MALQDLRGLLDPDHELPIGGTTYRVPPPTAKTGLRMQLMRDSASMQNAGVELNSEDAELLAVADDEEPSFYGWALGTAYQAMLDGGVTLPEIRVAAGAAFIFWTAAPGHAHEDLEAFWASQADPRRALTEQKTSTPAGKGSTSTAEASGTKPRKSGTGTSSPRGTRKGPKAQRALRSAS